MVIADPVEFVWAIYEGQAAAGMDCALLRHGVDFEALEGNCGKPWCENCWWHPQSSWWPGHGVPEWWKPPARDLFSWGGVQ